MCKYIYYKYCVYLFIDITLIKVYILNILHILCFRNTAVAPFFFFFSLVPVENTVLHHMYGLVHTNYIVELHDSSGSVFPFAQVCHECSETNEDSSSTEMSEVALLLFSVIPIGLIKRERDDH